VSRESLSPEEWKVVSIITGLIDIVGVNFTDSGGSRSRLLARSHRSLQRKTAGSQ